MSLKKILDYTIFETGHVHIKVEGLLYSVLFIVGMYVLLKLIKKSIYRLKTFDEPKKYSIYTLVKYIVITLALVSSLQILGFNLSILVAGSAALLVGLGMGIQNLFNDYISGIIMLIDSTLEVGDVIEVNGIVAKVQQINLRTTKVLTREDKNIVLPNSMLTSSELINWTLNEENSRFGITVGVDYSSDIHKVMKIMNEAAANHKEVSNSPKPFVLFENYADSSLIFTVYFWVIGVFKVEKIQSEIRIEILEQFREQGVTIPFPQRVVYSKQI